MNELIEIATPEKLWEEFDRLANFNDGAYDAALRNDIFSALGIPSNENLKEQLRIRQVGVEELLSAILNAMQPFSLMLTELLNLFERVGAKQSDRNLQVSFDFDKASRFNMDLDSFRRDIKAIEEKLVPIYTVDDPWSLYSQLEDSLKSYKIRSVIDCCSDSEYHTNCRDLVRWLIAYNEYFYSRNALPETLPECPTTKAPSLDRQLNRLLRLVSQSLAYISRVFDPELGSFTSISNALGNQTRAERLHGANVFLRAETDRWSGFIVGLVVGIIDHICRIPSEDDRRRMASGIARAIEQALDNSLTYWGEAKVKYEELKSVLSLPYWKRRYELYSAWVLTQIDKATHNMGAEYYVVNDTLSFSFKGSCLAKCINLYPPCYIVAELRTPMESPVGKESRKGHIQPDYSIVTEPTMNPDNTLAVIECKQYKKPNVKNFRNALTDYAKGRPNATVLIADYGRAPKRYSIEEGIRSRVDIFGFVRPGSVQTADFCKRLRAGINMYYSNLSKNDSSCTHPWNEEHEPCVVEMTARGKLDDLFCPSMMKSAFEQLAYIFATGRGEWNHLLCLTMVNDVVDERKRQTRYVVDSFTTHHSKGKKYGCLESPLNADCEPFSRLTVNAWNAGSYTISVINRSLSSVTLEKVSVTINRGNDRCSVNGAGELKPGEEWRVFKCCSYGFRVIDQRLKSVDTVSALWNNHTLVTIRHPL